MFGLGAQEIILILLIAVFFFGGEKLPEMAKGLGKGLREFKRASEEMNDAEKEQHGRMKVVSQWSGDRSPFQLLRKAVLGELLHAPAAKTDIWQHSSR